jgi:hypothetical protein
MTGESATALIDQMIEQRAPLTAIEEWIEGRSDLDESAKSALWLYAWVEIDQPERRRVVSEIVAGVLAPL